jgi:tetraacyldisaccharide 4'-kinase
MNTIYRIHKTFGFLLLPLSIIYGSVFFLIKCLYRFGIVNQFTYNTKIISVGNITVGGTGKTPFVIFIAHIIKKSKKRVAVVSRGYGRPEEDNVIDINSQDDREGGEEPWLIAKKSGVPVVVSSKKGSACTYAVTRYEPDIIVLDDGFQSFSIKRDIDIILLDATDDFLDYYLLPAGKLREPLSAIKRADIVVITRTDQSSGEKLKRIVRGIRGLNARIEIFTSSHKIVNLIKIPERKQIGIKDIEGKRILSVSSIGNNRSFVLTLRNAGVDIVHAQMYLDHHRYSKKDIEEIKKLINKHSVFAVITTEKDIYSLAKYAKDLGVPLYALTIEIQLSDAERFRSLLTREEII